MPAVTHQKKLSFFFFFFFFLNQIIFVRHVYVAQSYRGFLALGGLGTVNTQKEVELLFHLGCKK